MIDIDKLLKTQLDVGTESEHISNPFTGATILLTPEVAAGCDWFREHNSKAYMVLLD